MIRALLGGLLVWQAFTHWYLAVPGVALWLWSLHDERMGARMWRTVVYGAALYGPLVHWFTVLGTDAWLLMTLLCVLPLLIVALPGERSGPVTLAAAITVAEWVHSEVPFGGFPWGLLAYTQVDGPLSWAARLGGQELVTALVALVGAAFAGRGRWGTGRVGTMALAASLAATGFLLPVAGTGSVAVAAVQGNVPRPALAPQAQRAAVLDNHIQLTTRTRVGQAQLVVWPEDVVAGDPLADAAVRLRIDAAVSLVGRPVLVGGLVHDAGQSGPTNSSLLWLPRSGMVERYDKVHIVPFGEYLPFREQLAARIGRFDLVPVDMRAGERPGIFTDAVDVFGALICFEVAYDDHVRQLVDRGAHYIVVQSNNATYLSTDQPRQQFAITRFRALEHARGLVVATTTGVTGVVDERGRVTASAPALIPTVVQGEVPLVQGVTVADRLGDWVTPISLLVLASTWARARRRRRA